MNGLVSLYLDVVYLKTHYQLQLSTTILWLVQTID